MKPIEKRVEVYRGDTQTFTFDFSAFGISNVSDVKFYVRPEPDGQLLLRLTLSNTPDKISVDGNTLAVRLEPNDTKPLHPGTYEYDIELHTDTGVAKTVFRGNFVVIGDIATDAALDNPPTLEMHVTPEQRAALDAANNPSSDNPFATMEDVNVPDIVLSGDVTGGVANTVVVGIQGRGIDNAAPSDGQVLMWDANSSKWSPKTGASSNPDVGGDLSGTANSATVIALRGIGVGDVIPTKGDRLLFDGQLWTPSRYAFTSLIIPRPPKIDDFTWHNKGTNGYAESGWWGIYLRATYAGQVDDIKALTQPAPNGSFTVTLGFYSHALAVRWHKVGLLVYNRNTGKSLFIMTTNNVACGIGIHRTELTAYGSAILDAVSANLGQPSFFRIHYDDNAKQYSFLFSADGIHFTDLQKTEGTAYVGEPPDIDVGIGAMVGEQNPDAALTAVHWEVIAE